MDIKKLEAAAELIEDIKEIDFAIIDLEKFAHHVASATGFISLDFNIPTTPTDLSKDRQAIGSSFANFMQAKYGPIPWLVGIDTDGSQNKAEKSHNLNISVFETVALQVLGVLLRCHQEERAGKFKELQDLGINF